MQYFFVLLVIGTYYNIICTIMYTYTQITYRSSNGEECYYFNLICFDVF